MEPQGCSAKPPNRRGGFSYCSRRRLADNEGRSWLGSSGGNRLAAELCRVGFLSPLAFWATAAVRAGGARGSSDAHASPGDATGRQGLSPAAVLSVACRLVSPDAFLATGLQTRWAGWSCVVAFVVVRGALATDGAVASLAAAPPR